ncbi:MAG: hypothetical protein GX187_05435 [Clostridiaceae bacterium]|nr:hypothetical protein [Clostridiaceae bacterium]
MRQDTIRWKLTIKAKSPLHIHGGIKETGVRGLLQRRGEYFIPATTIKGKWRSALRGIQGTACRSGNGDEPCGCLSCRIFGESGYYPSNIIVSDCMKIEQQGAKKEMIRSRIAIDRFRKTAVDGALVFTEVIPEGTVFEGRVELEAKDLEDREIALLKAALTELVTFIGGHASTGLGSVSIELEVMD